MLLPLNACDNSLQPVSLCLDGLHISIQHEEATPSPTLAVAAAAVRSSPPPAPSSPPSADGAMREVWSANKAKFLIYKYKELKDKIGTSGGFR